MLIGFLPPPPPRPVSPNRDLCFDHKYFAKVETLYKMYEFLNKQACQVPRGQVKYKMRKRREERNWLLLLVTFHA